MINRITGLIGIVLICIAIIVGIEKTISMILLSIGTSILASAIVSGLNEHYIIQQNDALKMTEQWGLKKIYQTRAEINCETNELLKTTQVLSICAMGMKGFRDAQGKNVEACILRGMRLRILTIDPNSDILSQIDNYEGVTVGSTKSDIEALVMWIRKLKEKEIFENQIQLKHYDNYPYEFYFNMDGVVFTGPYQNKTSQQTITYQYAARTLGSNKYEQLFESLWENANDAI